MLRAEQPPHPLLRCSWEAVDHIVNRVVAEHIDDARLDGLVRIGVDEVSYKRGHRHLTIVADHDAGRVVWVGKERTKQSFESFFDTLGPHRSQAIEASAWTGPASICRSCGTASHRPPSALTGST
jgi:transposase